MSNLGIYDAVRAVPQEAQKQIIGGRLKGKTDINPMWRIKALTEQFGPCGIGWRYEIKRLWLESGASGEVAAFSEIVLYVYTGGEWSAGIPGIGGSMFVESEKAGPHTSDECYKMATTDALSVACKALGVGADIYWEADRSKYDKAAPAQKPDEPKTVTATQAKEIYSLAVSMWGEKDAQARLRTDMGIASLKGLPDTQYAAVVKELQELIDGNRAG